MLKRKMILVFFVVLSFAVGCATVNVQMTKQDMADWMLSIYNAQYADYKTWFVTDSVTGDFKVDAQGNAILKPGTPPGQVAILQKKKAVFKEVWPLILTYAEYAKTGTVPAGTVIGEVEARAISLINDLIRTK